MDSRLEKILVLSTSTVLTLTATNTAGYLMKEFFDQSKDYEDGVNFVMDRNVFDYAYSIFFGAGEYICERMNNQNLRV